jgi:uncharacterized protein (TIGR02231 family)
MPKLSSAVIAVTVFADRARVTRRGKTDVEQGPQRLEFDELPVTLQPESVRVAVRGTAPSRLLGVDVRRAFYAEAPAVRVQELETQLQALKDEDAADEDRAKALAAQLGHVHGLGGAANVYAYGLAQGKTTIDFQDALLGFIDRQHESLQERLRTVAVRRRERGKAVARLEQELAQVRGTRPRERYTAGIELQLDAAGEVEADVTYVLPGASWRPLYDVRLRGDDLEVTYLAEVQQGTGEDWAGVALALSTARPAVATSIPRLEPWHVYLAGTPVAPARARGAAAAAAWRGPASDEFATTLAAPKATAPAYQEAEVETARVENSGTSLTFQVPGSTDVPSDNSPHKATVAVFPLRPRFDYVTVPKLAAAVFRRAKVVNTSPYTLLAGRAQLFAGDDYLGAADLKLTAPGQGAELFFGADDRMGVERGLTKRDVAKTFMGGRRRIHYAYEVRLLNHTGVGQEVTVVDHVPLPQHEDVKVALDAADPKPDRQSDLNILIWKLELPPGGERKVRYGFTVEHPREAAVTGL